MSGVTFLLQQPLLLPMIKALLTAKNQPFVDKNNIGVIGHMKVE